MRRLIPLMLVIAFGAITLIALSSTASAQEDTIHQEVIIGDISDVPAADLPLVFDCTFENGTFNFVCDDNGKFEKQIDPNLGELVTVTLFGQSIKIGEPTVVTFPSGAKRVVTVRHRLEMGYSGGHWYIRIINEYTVSDE